RQAGADAAEIRLSQSRTLSVSVRNAQTDQLEYEADQSASVQVYCTGRSGSAGTTDLSAGGLDDALTQAMTIARFTERDRYAGLADADLMARDWPDLSLYHPWALSADEAGELGCRLEAAARAHDPRIEQVEEANVVCGEGVTAYGNSHGFVGVTRASHNAMSCVVIARDDKGMQRDAAFTQAHAAEDLDAAEVIGRRAAERTVACLGARTPPTTTAPVLFVPRVARSLWGHFVSAISGGALYRDASFLKERVDSRIMATGVELNQRPHRPRGLASAGYDADGVATRDRQLVADGILRGYLLGAYSARRLGLQSTGNAGGVFNLEVTPGTDDFDALVRGMGRGLVVTRLMGQGVNIVTGDYSRGAAGYWVENGEAAYPVENVTIAGNLADMFMQIEALGADVDAQSAIPTPSVCIGAMTIAGQ
ncbi:MAG: metalloprotease PmbA, partial [Luteimonas sp.]|nr:metalloprotease PmbA [Luteimonas sp.]